MRRRQSLIGLALALAIGGAWVALHVYAVFFHVPAGRGAWLAPPLVLALTWLNVGLFIVAHDCMHGSLAPGRPAVNRAVGRVALALYAGFSLDRLAPNHLLHHRHPGGDDDPDYATGARTGFWPWFAAFVRRYFGWREFTIVATVLTVYVLVLGAAPLNALLFAALPAILSALQLFYFGTYRPHRPGHDPWADGHRARSDGYPWLVSLLTCFHFGYHHEHHRSPHLPWWGLPAARGRPRRGT